MRTFPVVRSVRTWVVMGVGAALLVGGSVAVGDGASSGRPGLKAQREEALVELGRRLFFDPRASRTGARSCASCHDPLHGFSDPATYSDDELGRTKRHSQTLLNSHKNPNAHWDGEFGSVEQLVLARVGALQGGHHGFGDLATASEARERARQGRREVKGVGPATSRAPDSGEAPPAAPQGSTAPGGTTEPAGDEAPEADPAEETAGPETNSSPDPGAEGPGSEGFVPAPKDNPKYVGQFAQPTGSVGFGLRKAKDEPQDPAAPEPTTPSDPETPAEPEGDGAASTPANDGKDAGTTTTAPPPADATPEPKKAPESDKDAERRRREEEQAQLDAIARLPRVAEVLEEGGRYREAFQAAFGSDAVSDVRIAQAVAAYVRTIRSTPSAYDRHVAGDAGALSPLARQGLALFRGRAGCAQCHTLSGDAALTDYAFHNTGIAWREVPADVKVTLAEADAALDAGRQGVSSRPVERRAFKTPTLRDVALRAPYMHDGSLATLADVVKHYAAGGTQDPRQDARIKAFEVTAQETAALVAFLESLTGDVRAGRAESSWQRRAESTTLTVLDAAGRPLADVRVRLVPVGDALPGAREPAREIALVTDARGRVTFPPPTGFTHVQAVLPADMGRLPEEWIPDSARTAVLRAPVKGRVRVVLTAADVRELPEVLAVEFPGATPAPGLPEPRATLARVGAVTGEGGVQTALYAGWIREDLPAKGRLCLPGSARTGPVIAFEAGTTQSIDLR